MKKDSYKLGKILATSAIVSDAPLGPPKPKRTKLKLVILAVILGYVGFTVYSSNAMAHPKEEAWDDEMWSFAFGLEQVDRKKACHHLSIKISQYLNDELHQPTSIIDKEVVKMSEVYKNFCTSD